MMNCAISRRVMPITKILKVKANIMNEVDAPKKWGWFILFTSSTALICCALPILLVTLGLGAVSASLFAYLPVLVTLAHYKGWMFTFSGAVLAFTSWILYRSGRSCPADPIFAEQCEKVHRWNIRVFWVSVGIWSIGFIAAYLALPIYLWIGG